MTNTSSPEYKENLFKIFKAYFDSMEEGVFIYRSKYKLLYANEAACKMHGRSEDELLTMHPENFIHPDTYAVFLEFISALEKGEEFNGTAYGLTSDQKKFTALVYGRPIIIDGTTFFYSTVTIQ